MNKLKSSTIWFLIRLFLDCFLNPRLTWAAVIIIVIKNINLQEAKTSF